jgi:hypothetical protein
MGRPDHRDRAERIIKLAAAAASIAAAIVKVIRELVKIPW